MATIMPEAENVQKAIKWISASLESENLPLQKLIETIHEQDRSEE